MRWLRSIFRPSRMRALSRFTRETFYRFQARPDLRSSSDDTVHWSLIDKYFTKNGSSTNCNAAESPPEDQIRAVDQRRSAGYRSLSSSSSDLEQWYTCSRRVRWSLSRPFSSISGHGSTIKVDKGRGVIEVWWMFDVSTGTIVL